MHFVTLLEEMPVQETLDGIAEAARGRSARRRHLHQHGARSRRCPQAVLDAAAEGRFDVGELALGLKAAGLADGGRRHLRRPRRSPRRSPSTPAAPSWSSASARRSARPACRRYELPLLADGVDLAGLYELAESHPHPGSGMSSAERGKARDAPSSTSTRSSTTRAPGSSSAAASGGVGKTTTAAALGLRAAERGRCAVVLTVDPARRLAQSMGLTELDNTPRLVSGRGGRRAAARDDARHEADLRRDHRGARRPRAGPPDPGEPLLPVAVVQLRRHAGVHGDGEARPAPPLATSGT